MIALQGQIKQIQGLKGKLSKPTGNINSDHYKTQLNYAYTFVKTIVSKNTLMYYDVPENIKGLTTEIIRGTKSLDNPSMLKSKVVNGIELYSLPDGTCDTMKITDGTISVERKCGYAVINGDTPVTAIIQSGDSRVASGFFAIGYTKTTFDNLIEPRATNVYCNRLSVSTQTALTAVTETAIYINSSQALYVILPTGTCDEDSTSVAEWLNNHQIEIIYPIASPKNINEVETV